MWVIRLTSYTLLVAAGKSGHGSTVAKAVRAAGHGT